MRVSRSLALLECCSPRWRPSASPLLPPPRRQRRPVSSAARPSPAGTTRSTAAASRPAPDTSSGSTATARPRRSFLTSSSGMFLTRVPIPTSMSLGTHRISFYWVRALERGGLDRPRLEASHPVHADGGVQPHVPRGALPDGAGADGLGNETGGAPALDRLAAQRLDTLLLGHVSRGRSQDQHRSWRPGAARPAAGRRRPHSMSHGHPP